MLNKGFSYNCDPKPLAPLVWVSEHELTDLLCNSAIQAICLTPLPLQHWQEELSEAIEKETFRVPRTELTGLSMDAMATWLDRHLPHHAVSRQTRDALLSDLLHLFHIQQAVSGAATFRLRIFTGMPNRRCGFHVDTVSPGLSPWGLVRVYNGAGTYWVEPEDILSMQSFYQWLQCRDTLIRRYPELWASDHPELEHMDQSPYFLNENATIQCVPSRTTVVFRHLDAAAHWSNHSTTAAWIHCSPMQGKARLVVNISAARPQYTD